MVSLTLAGVEAEIFLVRVRARSASRNCSTRYN